ncbi:hypothetical protein JMN32_06905 [Fulvivirga sp. 29W222]|uniref:Uncharacterized protein n=1 Tax=Fulvivirga marina TaxID=2494733 RepID=A0A937FX58_9BACT|nr:hypothetical protein [Fulvivirga marina]MBL6446031.1 hypothetical protein [Fulvivirga marina]
MSRKDQIICVVREYEQGKRGTNETIKMIYDISGHEVDRDYLDNYWRSEDLDSFAGFLAIEAIIDWKQIDDHRALGLIKEILSDLTDDPVIYRNAEALEKRFGKPEGKIDDLIFGQNITDPEALLLEMKKSTTILT